MNIRPATAEDTPQLLRLRNHFITSSNATFDEIPLEEGDILGWIGGFAESGPYRLLVAESEENILGYASSQRYRAHPAFRQTAETSIYVAPGSGGRGVGSSLYESLFSLIQHEDLHSFVVGIALPNEPSVRLHRRFGFQEVGVFREYAVKNGEYVSSVWLQRLK